MKKAEAIKNIGLVSILRKLSPQDRNLIIDHLNDHSCEFIYECIYNGITNPNISKKSKKLLRDRLQNDKTKLRYLARPGGNSKRKRKILTQVGGFLPFILGAVLPILTSLLQK